MSRKVGKRKAKPGLSGGTRGPVTVSYEAGEKMGITFDYDALLGRYDCRVPQGRVHLHFHPLLSPLIYNPIPPLHIF
jgi:hypothetical protein